MSNRHVKSVASSGDNRDRAFDPRVVERARALAARYPIRVERNRRGYVGTVTELPTVFGVGASEKAALSDARRHLKWALAYLIEAGRAPSPKR
jgi:predicted RNase H-like HicB family nuclease